MSAPLWTLAEVVAATGAALSSPGTGEGGANAPDEGLAARRGLPHAASPSPAFQASSPVPGEEKYAVAGVSIDTRTIRPGDLFIALKDMRDGHEFVTAAFKAGAAAALVQREYERKPEDGVLLCVDDPLAALEKLGVAARARLSPDARVIAVTGSAGKTTTKEMLRTCLSAIAPGQVHASEKSYNNHWGVPLTLARMPADTRYAVFEIGMNHAGEITPLSKMVRPHVAIITTVAPAHLGHFNSVAEIADAKAEIFAGLVWDDEPGQPKSPRVAIINDTLDQSLRLRLITGADRASAKRLGFGGRDAFTVEIGEGSVVLVDPETKQQFGVGQLGLQLKGTHNQMNALAAVVALWIILGFSAEPNSEFRRALAGFSQLQPLEGRGSVFQLRAAKPYPEVPVPSGPEDTGRIELAELQRKFFLIDESYNANPASMAAALATPWDHLSRFDFQRKRSVAVLGDMLELGEQSPRLHRELLDAIEDAKVDIVFACGPMMKHLFDALPQHIKSESHWAETAAELEGLLLATVRGGDVVMIKGSNGMKLSALVEALKKRHSAAVPPVSG